MNEHEFLLKLRERANEQEKLIKGILFPNVFLKISLWLGNHPLRIIIPFAIFLTLMLRGILGPSYYAFILKMFGKL